MSRPLLAAACAAIFLATFGCEQAPEEKKKTEGGKPADGLKALNKIDKKEGKGPAAQIGDTVYMVYTGKLKNGSIFDSNDKPGANPLAVTLGNKEVILGWEQGIPGMKVGGERDLEIPYDLAYGKDPHPGGKIPGYSDLYFSMKLLDMVKKGEENVFDSTDLTVGTGPAAANGDTVTIDYKATLVNGKRVDSTYERNKSESFKLGNGDVIKGLEYGLVGMKVGGKRKLRIPPNIGYGVYGLNMVPGNQIVLFEVELKGLKKG